MKTITRICLASAAALLAVGCSEEQAKDAGQGIENIAQDPALQGEYADDCSSSKWLDASEKKELHFNGNQVEAHTVFYLDENCQDEGARLVYLGEFEVNSDGLPNSEGGSMKVDLQEAEVRVSSQSLADLLNAANFCGIENYKAGATVSLKGNTNDTLCPLKDIPTTLYGAYRVEQDKLFLSSGNLADMASTKDEREKELNREHPYYQR